jgi:hypothetical protein
LTSSLLPSSVLSPLAAEPLRDDMIGLGSEARGEGRSGGMPSAASTLSI